MAGVASPPVAHDRLTELDALRGLAALAVVAFHYTTHYGAEIGHVQPSPLGFVAGNYGVQLFFTISGFVIFMTLARTSCASDFVVSRVSRLFPAYWAAIMLTSLVVYGMGMAGQRLPLRDVLLDFTMVQEILGGRHLDGSYWTLQVELFFYAQMLFWFATGQLGRIHWIIAAWLVLAVAFGLANEHALHFSYTAGELLILRHIPFFALGILFRRLHDRQGQPLRDVGMIAATLVAIAVASPLPHLLAALACCVIFLLFLSGMLGWLKAAPLAFLGTISYSLYLLHQAIGFALIHQLEHRGVATWTALLATLLVVMALATALTFLVERPAMRWIRATWKRKRLRLQLA